MFLFGKYHDSRKMTEIIHTELDFEWKGFGISILSNQLGISRNLASARPKDCLDAIKWFIIMRESLNSRGNFRLP